MTDQILGFFTPWIIYAIITILHIFIPARKVVGYVTDELTGKKLTYRLNGLIVLIVMMLLWFVAGNQGIIPYDWLYTTRWYSLAGAFTLGIIYSLVSVLPYPAVRKILLADLFFGRLKNPQYLNGRVDAKMWLYLVGAVMLELHVLSFSAHYYFTFNPEGINGVFLCAAFITFFVFDYLSNEEVHLYTYDFFAERLGFKLGWGCLVFYPYFYAIALWASVDILSPELSTVQILLYSVVFITGWVLARGANLQKFYFKTQPTMAFIGIRPETVEAKGKSLLVNGFWGLSRHINYLGEILMASGIALTVTPEAGFWPWLYPLYYVALLVPRQIDDDKRCSVKYGALWQQYSDKVRYRIIPFLY